MRYTLQTYPPVKNSYFTTFLKKFKIILYKYILVVYNNKCKADSLIEINLKGNDLNMSKATKISVSQGKGTKFETTGILTINEDGVICIDNEIDGTVEPHLALSALDLHNQVVTLKIVRKEEEDLIEYNELV